MTQAESAQPAAWPLWALPPPLTDVVDRQRKQACGEINTEDSSVTPKQGWKQETDLAIQSNNVLDRKMNQIQTYIYIYIYAIYKRTINCIMKSVAAVITDFCFY